MKNILRASALGLGLLAGCSGASESKLPQATEFEHEHDQNLTPAETVGRLACKIIEDQRNFMFFLPKNTSPDDFVKELTGKSTETGVIEGPVECASTVSPEMIETGLAAVVTGELQDFNNESRRVNQLCAVVGMLMPAKPDELPAPSRTAYVVCPNLSKTPLDGKTI